MMEKIHTP